MSSASNANWFLAYLALASGSVAGLTCLVVAFRNQIKRRWIKLVALNALLALCVLAVSTLLGEIYMRFFFNSTDSFAGTLVHQKWMGKHWRLNNVGLRDDVGYQLGTDPGAKRVTIIGDSFTAGHGIANVGDRFGNIVRSLLPGDEVHVLAENGWDTGQQLSALQAAISHGYEADAFILCYCLNDAGDINPRWRALNRRVPNSGPPEGLLGKSYLLNWLYWRIKIAADPDAHDYGSISASSYEGHVWQTQQARLLAMKTLVEASGAKFALVILPFFNYPPSGYPFAATHGKLVEFCISNGIEFLDLQNLISETGGRSLVVNRFDAHPNETAHRMIADELVPFVREKLER